MSLGFFICLQLNYILLLFWYAISWACWINLARPNSSGLYVQSGHRPSGLGRAQSRSDSTESLSRSAHNRDSGAWPECLLACFRIGSDSRALALRWSMLRRALDGAKLLRYWGRGGEVIASLHDRWSNPLANGPSSNGYFMNVYQRSRYRWCSVSIFPIQ
jgi:hypothetical protein